MDLHKLDTIEKSEEGTKLHLVDHEGEYLYEPDGDLEHPTTITLRGNDSPEVMRYRHTLANDALDKSVRAGRMKFKASAADDLAILAMCTIGWENIKVNGELLEFNRLNATNLYKWFPFIKEQANAHIGDRANYVGNSQKTS